MRLRALLKVRPSHQPPNVEANPHWTQPLLLGTRSSTDSRPAGSTPFTSQPNHLAHTPPLINTRRTLSNTSDIETSELRDFLIHDTTSVGSTTPSWREISQAQVQQAYSARRL